ncbi:MAG: HAMP domain-containing histidine kinase, partial [Clostridiales bacterium]|nr:HAMP domain-containing histidine kinase [Clostridiales bacterium]
MKFFDKLYISMLLLLTVALAVTEYTVVALSLNTALENRIENSLKQHQLIKYAIQSDLLSASQQGTVGANVVSDIAQQTSESMKVELALQSNNSKFVYYENLDMDVPNIKPDDEEIKYITEKTDDGKKILVMSSSFTSGNYNLKLLTFSDITSVYDDADNMQTRCMWIFIIVISAGIIFTTFFSIIITKPIKELTRVGEAFCSGDYSGRVQTMGSDEIGELAGVYNNMADTIENKIRDLELAVKQREDFTAAFAHELKTPMTSIIGYADTLYQKDLPEHEAKAAAEFIVNEGMRLEALSFKLLELITLKNDDFLLEEIEMKDFLQDIKETIKPAAEKRGVRMFFDFEPGYVKIEFDLFKTLILNLIDNAMKSGSDTVAVLSQAKGDEYMIAIVDHGRGIPEKELRRVTEAFYMVDKARSRKQHGAGLGLALCQKIAEIHGTRLDIRSREGQGTAIRIKLKLA